MAILSHDFHVEEIRASSVVFYFELIVETVGDILDNYNAIVSLKNSSTQEEAGSKTFEQFGTMEFVEENLRYYGTVTYYGDNGLNPDTQYEYLLVTCWNLPTASNPFETGTVTTTSLPTFSVSSSYNYIRASISVKKDFEEYRVYYRKSSESSSQSVDYSNKTSNFNADITDVVSGTKYVMNVRATDGDGNTYMLSDGVEIFCQYAIRAQLAFNVGQGSGSFSKIQSPYFGSDETTGYIEITIPSNYTPTAPSGSSFLGWVLSGTTKQPGETFTVGGSTLNPLYTADAQYSGGGVAKIYDSINRTWISATPKIYHNGNWVTVIPKIYHNGQWVPAS